MNNRYREEELNENAENANEPVEETIDEAPSIDNSEEDVKIKDKKKNKYDKKINELNEEIERLKNEVKASNEKYLRLLADTENFKKRIDDERIRERKYGCQRLLEKLIVNIDIFDKAVNIKTTNDELSNFLIGFQMINNNLKTTLEDEGVKKIKIEKMFDPRFHHAVDTDYDETKEEGEILSVIKDGYMYKDRVLQVAMVKVNKKTQEENEKTE